VHRPCRRVCRLPTKQLTIGAWQQCYKKQARAGDLPWLSQQSGNMSMPASCLSTAAKNIPIS